MKLVVEIDYLEDGTPIMTIPGVPSMEDAKFAQRWMTQVTTPQPAPYKVSAPRLAESLGRVVKPEHHHV